MTDLYFAIAVMLALSGGVFALVLKVSRNLSHQTALLLLLGVIGLLALFMQRVADSLRIADLLPFSNVVIWGEGSPLLIAAAVALAWRRIPAPWWRRAAVLVPLAALGLFRAYGWIWADLPPLGPQRWSEGVCLQTTDASCSAAAAATLLSHYGIPSTEAEMAELCLTWKKGTPMLGLYRGLKLKTAATALEVEPFHTDVEGLRAISRDGPVILSVGLPLEIADVDPRYHLLWGWTPGMKHTVVLFGFTRDGRARIGDPAVGREYWSEADLRVLWEGSGLRLIEQPHGL